MLRAVKRLNLSKDFKWVAKGRKIETPLFKIFYRTGENVQAKVGVALSKNYFRRAHERNQVKRMISQVIEQLYDGLPSNLNLVIMPKSAVLEIEKEKIKQKIQDVQSNYFSN